MVSKAAPAPIYAIPNNDPNAKKGKGPDETNDNKTIIDRESEDFQRFLNEMERKFSLEASPAIREQIVMDCWTKLKDKGGPFNKNALQMALEAVAQLQSPDAEVEIIFWASMPSAKMLEKQLKPQYEPRNNSIASSSYRWKQEIEYVLPASLGFSRMQNVPLFLLS